MPSGAVQILLDVAGEFTGLYQSDPDKVERMLGYAALEVDASAFGTKFGLAVAYLAAHKLKIDAMAQKGKMVAGRVTSQTKDALGGAPQLLNKQTSDEALRSTDYGWQFMSIRNSLVIGAPTTLDDDLL